MFLPMIVCSGILLDLRRLCKSRQMPPNDTNNNNNYNHHPKNYKTDYNTYYASFP